MRSENLNRFIKKMYGMKNKRFTIIKKIFTDFFNKKKIKEVKYELHEYMVF